MTVETDEIVALYLKLKWSTILKLNWMFWLFWLNWMFWLVRTVSMEAVRTQSSVQAYRRPTESLSLKCIRDIIKTSSGIPRKSSEVFGNFRKSQKRLNDLRAIFGNVREIVGNLRPIFARAPPARASFYSSACYAGYWMVIGWDRGHFFLIRGERQNDSLLIG